MEWLRLVGTVTVQICLRSSIASIQCSSEDALSSAAASYGRARLGSSEERGDDATLEELIQEATVSIAGLAALHRPSIHVVGAVLSFATTLGYHLTAVGDQGEDLGENEHGHEDDDTGEPEGVTEASMEAFPPQECKAPLLAAAGKDTPDTLGRNQQACLDVASAIVGSILGVTSSVTTVENMLRGPNQSIATYEADKRDHDWPLSSHGLDLSPL